MAVTAGDQVTGRPQQIVLELKWTEDGQEHAELFGPWTQGDPQTTEGETSHLMAAHAFTREWASARNPDDLGEATVIVVIDPDEWRRQQQEGSDGG